MRNFAIILEHDGKVSECLKILEKERKVPPQEVEELPHIYGNIGIVLIKLKQYEKSMPFLKASADLFVLYYEQLKKDGQDTEEDKETEDDLLKESQIVNFFLGYSFLKTRKLGLCIKSLQTHLDHCMKLGDKENEVATLSMIGNVYYIMSVLTNV